MVLVEVKREVEFEDELLLQLPQLAHLDPAHQRVVGHPRTQLGLADLAEGHPLAASYAAQLQPQQAAERESQRRASRVAAVVVAHPLPQVLSAGPVRHVPRSDTDVQQTIGLQLGMRRPLEAPPIHPRGSAAPTPPALTKAYPD